MLSIISNYFPIPFEFDVSGFGCSQRCAPVCFCLVSCHCYVNEDGRFDNTGDLSEVAQVLFLFNAYAQAMNCGYSMPSITANANEYQNTITHT